MKTPTHALPTGRRRTPLGVWAALAAVALYAAGTWFLQVDWLEAATALGAIALLVAMGFALAPQDSMGHLRVGTQPIEGAPLLKLLNGGKSPSAAASQPSWQRTSSNARK